MSGSVFYQNFDRHDGGVGLKDHATHYCPGCGHGLVQKYLADAIEDLDIQDRTIAISPVGCAAFLYYYLDVGNCQAAHGRAPAVALGHKLANPDSVVISYQGDGDLASIGLAEIVHAAQLGVPITVLFVNNAIFGMTGGQMAPTTLMGQSTTTCPDGRTDLMGRPLKVAELIAQLDGPVYVERVALFDNKRRYKARKAIKKALQLQVENKGFSLIEVLSECPTHLHVDPTEAEQWVEREMVPEFPLGVKKDTAHDVPWKFGLPSYEASDVKSSIGIRSEYVPRYAARFPRHIADKDISLKLAGRGGDGAQTAAMLIVRAGVNEGFDATHIPSYGPESRGGTSYADVHLAFEEVLSPAAPEPDILVAFNSPSLQKFGPRVRPGGTILYDNSIVQEVPHFNSQIRVFTAPFAESAHALGRPLVKNLVALGALQGATDLFPEETFLYAIQQALKDKCAMIPLNEEAFRRGREAVRRKK